MKLGSNRGGFKDTLPLVAVCSSERFGMLVALIRSART